ncbi:hypothetical protein DSJ_24410 (plasmid) [Pantoea stewartii subsp. stewartii DC283]|uniref:Uncharacterized protein n=1 Tax=Pantoea stewartii subsp. stewartii DC283 TaxID=660596 RepID=A0ABN4Z7H1_PANSE|nr:hypothetical protein DSJ_24410 [Pantoea stewartii subsp. stewartii DC283]KAB0545576.1 hypothetical protein F7Q90_24235 [Pantoea stewartii subsp. stewartii]
MTVFCLASAFSTKTVQTKQNDYLLFNKAAFQLHFRCRNYDCIINEETSAVLYTLMDKYMTEIFR